MKNWETTKDFLRGIPLPVETRTYKPVSHTVFIDELQEKLKENGYSVIKENYLSTGDGKILTGNLRLFNDALPESAVLCPSINFVNSYNKMKKVSIRAAAMVLVCSNGMIANRTSAIFTKKHSKDVMELLKTKMIEVIKAVDNEFKTMLKNYEEMKAISLSEDVKARLVGDMFINKNLITPTQLGILKTQIKTSEHFSDGSLWSFYNNVTEAFKDNHPMSYDIQHIKFHTYITDKFGLSGSRGLYGDKIMEDVIEDADFTEEDGNGPVNTIKLLA